MKTSLRAALIIFCIAIVVFAQDPAFGQKLPKMPWGILPLPTYPEEMSCLNELRTAVRQLAERDFPGSTLYGISVVAMNDLSCEEPEHMANVVITVMLGPTKTASTKYLYGIFHVYFYKLTLKNKKELVSAAPLPPGWQEYSEADKWRESWCSFIRSVYRKELKEQGCE